MYFYEGKYCCNLYCCQSLLGFQMEQIFKLLLFFSLQLNRAVWCGCDEAMPKGNG